MGKQYKYGLFECFSDVSSCLCGSCCQPCAAGDIMDKSGGSYIAGFCIMVCIPMYFFFFYHGHKFVVFDAQPKLYAQLKLFAIIQKFFLIFLTIFGNIN